MLAFVSVNVLISKPHHFESCLDLRKTTYRLLYFDLTEARRGGGKIHRWPFSCKCEDDECTSKYMACYVKRLILFGFLDKQEARGLQVITMQKSVGVKSGYAE